MGRKSEERMNLRMRERTRSDAEKGEEWNIWNNCVQTIIIIK